MERRLATKVELPLEIVNDRDELELFITTNLYQKNIIVGYSGFTFYLFSAQEKIQLDCVELAVKCGNILPVEVKRVENHLKITVKYQRKYDFIGENMWN